MACFGGITNNNNCMTKLTSGIKNNSTSNGDQPILRNLGMSKHGIFKRMSGIMKTSGSQVGMPAIFVRGKRNAAMTATETKYISKRMKYCSLSNFSGNNVFTLTIFPFAKHTKCQLLPMEKSYN